MRDLEYYEGALFSSIPKIGDINPENELNYVGYERQDVLLVDGVCREVSFPGNDSPGCDTANPIAIRAFAILDRNNKVVHVEELVKRV